MVLIAALLFLVCLSASFLISIQASLLLLIIITWKNGMYLTGLFARREAMLKMQLDENNVPVKDLPQSIQPIPQDIDR